MKTHSNSENKKVSLHTTKNIKTKQIFKLLFLFYRDFFFIRLFHTCHSAVFFVSYKFLNSLLTYEHKERLMIIEMINKICLALMFFLKTKKKLDGLYGFFLKCTDCIYFFKMYFFYKWTVFFVRIFLRKFWPPWILSSLKPGFRLKFLYQCIPIFIF